MGCSEFLERFSEYRDGTLDGESASRFEDHLRGCPSCRRYEHVVEEGVALFRSLDAVEVPDDFRPRLQHRIYHVADEDALEGGRGSSGVTAATALGMAVLLSLVAWSPTFRAPEPEVELAPIVASRPAPPPRLPAAALGQPLLLEPAGSAAFIHDDRDLWARSHELLFRFSSLNRGPGSSPVLRRVGVD